MNIREIEAKDVPDLFDVRVATHENRLSREELAFMGINENAVREKLAGTFTGWLCEDSGRIVGFAMGDRSTGELWVIAVLPNYVGRGIGSVLLRRVEAWLFGNQCERVWLTTDVDTRLKAYSFYRQHGWKDDRIENGLRYMAKERASAGVDG